MKIFRKIVLAAFVFALSLPVTGRAQEEGGGTGGLSISPTRFEFVIERGKDELISVQVKNVSTETMIAKAFLNDFEPDGVTGNPKLIIDNNAEQSSSSLREFLVGLDDVTIAAGQTEVVNIPVQIPESAAPGAYYGALRFQATPADGVLNAENAQLSLNASVAALVLVEVPGDITEKIEITSIGAYLNDKKGSIFTKKPSKVGVQINNLGNGFSKPFGTVSVQGPWGTGEILNYELNDTSPRGNVLPNSERLFLEDFSQVKWPGRYTIEANISHGRGGEVLNAKTSFWYIPSWLIIVLIVLLAAIVLLAVFLYRRYVTKAVRRRK